MTTYLFIHGRSQEKKDAKKLAASWLKALNAGLATAGGDEVIDTDIRLPYYGDILFDLVSTLGGKSGAPDLEAVDPAAVLLAEMTTEAATRTGWEPTPSDPAHEIGMPGWISPSLQWLASNSKLDERIIRTWMYDVAYYLANEQVRKAVLDVVRESVEDVDGPVVVVGHSLGSVVAFDVVTSDVLPRGTDVPLLLTAGSPLGLEIVRKHLPAGARFPKRVDRWVSTYSRNDPVAIGHPIAGFYKGGGPVKDVKVSNPDETAHAIGSYLGHTSVAKAILGD